MTQCFEFALARRGLERARFLVYRPDLAANGDCESAFLDGVEGLVRHPAGTALGAALGRAGAEGEVLILVRNPRLVLDEALPGRIAAAGIDRNFFNTGCHQTPPLLIINEPRAIVNENSGIDRKRG